MAHIIDPERKEVLLREEFPGAEIYWHFLGDKTKYSSPQYAMSDQPETGFWVVLTAEQNGREVSSVGYCFAPDCSCDGFLMYV